MIECRVGDHLVEVHGHARSAEKGKDLVCASVTILVSALILRLTELEMEGRLGPVTVDALEEGLAGVTWEGDADETVATFVSGMRLLQTAHPENVHLEV